MIRPALGISMLLAVLAVSACGERDQTLAAGRHKSGDQPWLGAKNGFVVQTWTPSDKAAWEKQLRQRAQTQNEYNKVN
ncbi:MAG: hypothetical protein ABWY05_02005 [Noviherbaspirillum sp.]